MKSNFCLRDALHTLLALFLTKSSAQYFGHGLPTQIQPDYVPKLQSIFEARNLEFAFPTEAERQRVLAEGLYNPDGVIPIDVDVHYSHREDAPTIFLTIPRFGKGVPYSLAYLTNIPRPNGTEIQSYPNYDWHKSHGADCNGLTSVYRVQIDSCGRIWILDSGEIDFVQYCAPQLIAMDVESGAVLHRHRFPKGIYKENVSRFVTPLVDVDAHSCHVGHIYMADSIGDGIVVYNLEKSQSWRIENKYTYPHPDFGTFTIAGESFQLWDGTVAMTLTPRTFRDEPRMLYFHSLSSDWQMAIPLNLVNNASNWKLNDVSAQLDQFIVLGKRGTQCVASAMSEAGILLCGLVQPSGIHAWNICTPYTSKNTGVLLTDEDTLQFVSGMKIIKNHAGKEELWVLSNRLQKAFGAGLNFKEVNFRIQKCALDDLLAGRTCQL